MRTIGPIPPVWGRFLGENMYLGEILTADTANGLGMRLSIFVSGCTNRCPGCFQPQTWDFHYGREYTPEIENYLLRELGESFYDGLTVLGGEPFEEVNQRGLLGLIRRVRRELPEKNIWMYTGFTYDRDLVPGGCRYTEVTDELLDSIDVLVDGRFVREEKDISLYFRGSRNQRILDMKRTRAEGRIVLSPLNEKRK